MLDGRDAGDPIGTYGLMWIAGLTNSSLTAIRTNGWASARVGEGLRMFKLIRGSRGLTGRRCTTRRLFRRLSRT